MSKLLYNVLNISGGANAPHWLRAWNKSFRFSTWEELSECKDETCEVRVRSVTPARLSTTDLKPNTSNK